MQLDFELSLKENLILQRKNALRKGAWQSEAEQREEGREGPPIRAISACVTISGPSGEGEADVPARSR
jgi:hypothetical protein